MLGKRGQEFSTIVRLTGSERSMPTVIATFGSCSACGPVQGPVEPCCAQRSDGMPSPLRQHPRITLDKTAKPTEKSAKFLEDSCRGVWIYLPL